MRWGMGGKSHSTVGQRALGLLDLPLEVLLLVVRFLHTLEDFVWLSSSCRAFHQAFASSPPQTILSLAASSSLPLFRPQPYFLIAATSRQVSDWAIGSRENTERLQRAFQGGSHDLLELCVSKSKLTIEDFRRLYINRCSARGRRSGDMGHEALDLPLDSSRLSVFGIIRNEILTPDKVSRFDRGMESAWARCFFPGLIL